MRGARRAGLGGFVGARLFHYLDHLGQLRERPQEILAIWQGGIAVYSAFIGGVLAGWVRARQLRLDAWRLLDVAAPALLWTGLAACSTAMPGAHRPTARGASSIATPTRCCRLT
jgi:hypothetical protein